MDDYSVFMSTAASEPDADLEAQINDLATLVGGYHGVASGNDQGWSVVVSVDASSPSGAYTAAMAIVRAASGKAGLPDRPVVDVRIVRSDILDIEQSVPNIPDLVSGPEVAAMLGVNRQRVHQLAHGHPAFPKPLYRLGVGSLWDRRAIEEFAAGWERKPGRPRRTT